MRRVVVTGLGIVSSIGANAADVTDSLKAGRPVRLVFDRQETSGCSEEVVFGDFGIRRYLPAHSPLQTAE